MWLQFVVIITLLVPLCQWLIAIVMVITAGHVITTTLVYTCIWMLMSKPQNLLAWGGDNGEYHSKLQSDAMLSCSRLYISMNQSDRKTGYAAQGCGE